MFIVYKLISHSKDVLCHGGSGVEVEVPGAVSTSLVAYILYNCKNQAAAKSKKRNLCN